VPAATPIGIPDPRAWRELLTPHPHDLAVEWLYRTQSINGLVATAQGPIKTFPLRGIKESPPYLHDGRLLTLEDAVEFFNLVLEVKLDADEKKALVAFMRQL
jgi:cytochrome c peroxidase